MNKQVISDNLKKLANRAAKAQEREHNEPNYSSNKSIELFNEAAKAEGYAAVRWPGLYPQLRTSDGQWHDVVR